MRIFSALHYLVLLLVLKWCVLCTGFRIFGGSEAILGEFPYQASIRFSYNDAHFCGGSLIGPRHVLTAAHCVMGDFAMHSPSIISVVFGQLHLKITPSSVYRNATNIYVHEEYDPETVVNDIAIIEFEEALNCTEGSLITNVIYREKGVRPNICCTVTGWGLTEEDEDSLSDDLMKATVATVEFGKCSQMYENITELPKSSLCAGHILGKTDACQGDSGGPLICEGLLTGIVSMGVGCGNENYPGIYTDVSKFYDWINQHLNISTNTTDQPCEEGPDDEECYIFETTTPDQVLKDTTFYPDVNFTTSTNTTSTAHSLNYVNRLYSFCGAFHAIGYYFVVSQSVLRLL